MDVFLKDNMAFGFSNFSVLILCGVILKTKIAFSISACPLNTNDEDQDSI